MVSVSVTEVKARLSEYLRRARGGEEVLITDRGRGVAILSPVPAHVGRDARFQDLVDRGVIRPGKGPVPREFWDLPHPPDPERAVLEGLLEERREGW